MTNVVVLSEDQFLMKLRKEIKISLLEYDREKSLNEPERLFTINQISKRLKKSHSTIKKFCLSGVIQTTRSGLITEQAINDYLRNN